MNGYNFTERVRKILAIAREEAVRLEDEYVGPEHILLGIVRERDGIGAAVLLNLNVDLDALGETVEGLIVPPKRTNASIGPDLPYTQRGKRCLELAMAEARELDHRYVGSEHFLLGVLREENNIGARALAKSGITLEVARTETLRLLGNPIGASSGGASRLASSDTLRAAGAAPASRIGDQQREQSAWYRLMRALDVNDRLGTPSTVTLQADGTLAVPLGPDLLITVEFPPGVRIRRRADITPPDAAPNVSSEEKPA